MHHTASPSLQREEPTRPAYRRARLAFVALLGLSACTSDTGDPTPLRLFLETPVELPAPLPVQSMHLEVIPDAAPTLTVPPPKSDLSRIHEVYWTAPEPKTPGQLASDWGIKFDTLTHLNPDLDPDEQARRRDQAAGLQARPRPSPPSRSARPTAASCATACRCPRATAWRLRPVRRRAYGTHTTVAVARRGLRGLRRRSSRTARRSASASSPSAPAAASPPRLAPLRPRRRHRLRLSKATTTARTAGAT
jgi:hypothetical protein